MKAQWLSRIGGLGLIACLAVGPGCSSLASRAPAVNARRASCRIVRAEALSHATTLTPDQRKRLLEGARVEIESEFERCGDHYVGGLGYVLVKASPREVFESLNQLSNLSRVIRGTRTMTVTGVDSRGTSVLMEQGNSIVSAQYTATFRPAPRSDISKDWEVRFWLDSTKPHAIEDVWGTIRARGFDATRTLVTVGTVVNLGPGLIRMLFEGHLQRSILRMPRYVRQVVEGDRYVSPPSREKP